ncbi:hypothetical protein, partial [Sphingobacterium olei]|uniref:hypothetical protein n=1 Tax=Sphingobacterium olei TaxID=2571155 RepID=UPI00192E2F2C
TKPVPTELSTNEETESKASEEAPETSKPTGFKPRFKAGVTKPVPTELSTNEETESKASEEAPETSKPTGFKPRFKAGVTKPATDSDTKKNDQ